MSLNPEDSRRRGRSKSPGRRDERDTSRSRVEDPRERSRTRPVIERAPSPPSSKYSDPRYDDDRDRDQRRYDYGDGDNVKTSSRRSGREEPSYYRDDTSPPRKPKYSMPGDFDGSDKEAKLYRDGGTEKTYYEDRKPSRRPYSSDDESSPERPKYSMKDERPSNSKYDDQPSYSTESYKKETYRYEDDSKDRDRRKYEAEPKGRDRRKQEDDRRQWEEDIEKRARAEYEQEKAAKLREKGFHASASGSIDIGRGRDSPKRDYGRKESPPSKHSGLAYGESPPIPSAMRSSYAEPKQWEYARPEDTSLSGRQGSYGGQPPAAYGDSTRGPLSQNPFGSVHMPSMPSMPSMPAGFGYSPHSSQSQLQYGPPPSGSQGKVVTVEPGHRKSVSGANALTPHMSSLSVSTGHHSLSVSAGHGAPQSLANAPGSPLLESYHGTYQSISPMPSPLMIASQPYNSTTDIIETNPLTGVRQKHARFHDPADDAAAIARALKGSKAPDTDPLIEILPALTHDQIMDLRVEYKKMVKTGSEKKGVNIAKHIKLRLKEEDPSLMKACYAVALGKWESEAYWANFWYQGEKSRRELLIESLMGRTNAEIRAIKDGFSDKKYSDSLTKCMKTELKEDKFKKAVLLVLEEKRMEEPRPGYYLDRTLIEEDVRTLHKAVRSEKGGESVMIQIIVLRSDSHIREILKMYEATYHTNFAREMLKKSGNLVGELLAHILNGVINRPVRDALLLNHALTLTKSDSLRTELLVSRLVRYHWDGAHMEAVKREYRNRYGKDLQAAVRDGSKGAWGEFCEELCVRRMPDDVRRVERVQAIAYR